MTGPEHYREAEAKLEAARRIAHPGSGHSDENAVTLVQVALQRAQVHATLALAAATALTIGVDDSPTIREWAAVAGQTEIAEAQS